MLIGNLGDGSAWWENKAVWRLEKEKHISTCAVATAKEKSSAWCSKWTVTYKVDGCLVGEWKRE